MRIVANSYCEELLVFFWDEQRDASPFGRLSTSHTGTPACRRLRSLLSLDVKILRRCVTASTLLSEVTPPMSSKNPSAMISTLLLSGGAVFGVLGACMPVTRCWICATHEDLSLSILRLQKRWRILT